MDESELDTVGLVFNGLLLKVRETKMLALPLEVTLTDANEVLLLDTIWNGDQKFPDAFGTGYRPLDISKCQLPVTVTMKDANGRTEVMEITRSVIDDFRADIKESKPF